jgi:hypothetical protein
MAENKTADHELNTENTTALTCIDMSKEQTAIITGAKQLPQSTISSSQYELRYNIPAVGLHYDALQPNQTVNIEHVNKILGYKIKTHQEREELVLQCLWLGCPLHQRKNEATSTNDIVVQPTINGKTIQKFNELSKWWSLSNPTCTKTEATFTFLAYEMWEKGWEKEWEKEFMTMHGWSYDSKIKENIQNTCERQGYEMKGCIAKKKAS